MSNEPNKDAKANQSDESEYSEEARFEVKGRGYHEKFRVGRAGRIICVARTEMQEYPHVEKQPTGNGISGRYQEKSGLFTIHFNQAGTYVEAVKAEVFHGDSESKDKTKAWQAKQSRPILFLWGREQTDDSFLLTPSPGQEMVHLDGSSKDASNIFNYRLLMSDSKLALKEWFGSDSESSATIYELISNEPDVNYDTPTYMNDVLDTLPDSLTSKSRQLIRTYEHAPLTKQYYQWLIHALTQTTKYSIFGMPHDNSLANLIRDYFEKASKGSRVSDRIERQTAIRQIDNYLNYAVLPTQGSDSWHFDDLPLATWFTKRILAKNQISVSGSINRTYFSWLQEIVDQYARDGHGELDAIRKYLNITPRMKGDKARFRYTADFSFGGLQAGWWIFGGGYFEGKVNITQQLISTGEDLWKKSYHGWLYVAGSNSGVSVEFDPKVVGESDVDWSHRDMYGSFSVLSAEGAGDLVEIEGSENFPPLSLEKAKGGGRGLSLSGATGTLESWKNNERKPSTPPKNDGPYYKWFSAHLDAPEKHVHFRCGSAKLSDAAIRRIGFLCARELRCFMIPNNFLWVYGHADRLDKEDLNLKLSRLRAKNTLTVIREILGKNLLVKDIYFDGFGENEATNDQQLDGVPNPQYRRVDIILGGRLIGRLYGE